MLDVNSMPNNKTIVDAMLKAESILAGHKKIMVSISGGSDSDVMMDMIERCKSPENEIDYVFFDTGIESIDGKFLELDLDKLFWQTQCNQVQCRSLV